MQFSMTITKKVSESLFEASGAFPVGGNKTVPIHGLIQVGDEAELILNNDIKVSTINGDKILKYTPRPVVPADGPVEIGQTFTFSKILIDSQKSKK